jgi:hypothetical protein
VVVTTRPVPAARSVLGTEFDDFLFASIGEDCNGMQVSVLSGLARSDVDPWLEAAKLAQLPGETAAERLATFIGALPDRATPHPDSRTIATRLIALLPRPSGFNGGRQETLHSAWAAISSRPWWIYVVVMSFVLGSQFLIASHQQPAKPDNGEVNAVSTASPPVPPMNPGP